MNPEQKKHLQKQFEEKIMLMKMEEQQRLFNQVHASPEPKPGVKKDQDKNKQPFFELPTNQLNPKHIDDLNKDFDDIYGAHKRHDGGYYFETEEEATKFFQEQAAMGRSFLVKKGDADLFMYSDGKGHFFKGSQDELQEYLSALQKGTSTQMNHVTPFNKKPEPNAAASSKEEDEEPHQAISATV